MSSSGQFRLSYIYEMLDHCAEGYKTKTKKHRIWVYYKDKPIFRDLPKGEHGSDDPEIQIGKIKNLARFLGIEDCAADYFPSIKKQTESPAPVVQDEKEPEAKDA